MKRLIITIVLTSILHITHGQATMRSFGETGIHFEQGLTWAQILQKAKAEHKYIFVDCYATWCGPCKVMDTEVYTKKEVGEVYNREFISVKLQMDKTSNDDEQTKNRYDEAKDMSINYSISSYPTFLFFDETGKPVHKVSATKSVKDFIALAADAKDGNKQYYSILRNFELGRLDTAEEKGLAISFLYSDNILAGKIALDYLKRIAKTSWKDSANMAFMKRFSADSMIKQTVKEYINHLSNKEIFSNAIMLSFISKFTNHSTDRAFPIFYQQGDKVNKVIKKDGYAHQVVNKIIYDEELKPTIAKAKQSHIEPNWDDIRTNISGKFGKQYIDVNLSKGKMDWYDYTKEGENYCTSLIKWFEADKDISGLKDDKVGQVNDLNAGNLNTGAWQIFQKSNDTTKLEKALYWAELATNAFKDKPGYLAGVYIDTRANLLYKLGKTKEAIEWEEKALHMSPTQRDLLETFQKMREGKKTW